MSRDRWRVGLVLDDTLDKVDGVQQYVVTLGRWLAAQGHEVHYLVADTRRTDLPGVHSLGRVVTWRFNGNTVRTPLPARRDLARVVRELNLDIMHVQLPYSPFLGERVMLAANPRTVVVGTFHILPSARWHLAANRLLAWGLRRSLGRLTAVGAMSGAAAAFARSAYGLAAAPLPVGLDLARFRGASARRPARPVTVAFLGRLVPRKGVAELVRAFNGLPPEVEARLMIGGSGPIASPAAAPGRDVSWAGQVAEADKAAFLGAADVAVFPATGGESFGIVLVEAMAAGAGVVLGGNNPGYASVLEPEALFDPRDQAAFTAKLAHFITDAGARRQLHDRQQAAVEQFDIERVGPAMEEWYAAALKSKTAATR